VVDPQAQPEQPQQSVDERGRVVDLQQQLPPRQLVHFRGRGRRRRRLVQLPVKLEPTVLVRPARQGRHGHALHGELF
jgi:hypothetical protein